MILEVMILDKKWNEVRSNPPENWQEIWRNRKKLTRFDTEIQATKWIEKNEILKQHLKIHIHPKDGFVVYTEER